MGQSLLNSIRKKEGPMLWTDFDTETQRVARGCFKMPEAPKRLANLTSHHEAL